MCVCVVRAQELRFEVAQAVYDLAFLVLFCNKMEDVVVKGSAASKDDYANQVCHTASSVPWQRTWAM